MSDVHEPLERYKNEFKAAFRKNAEEAFDELERQSSINKAANKSTCSRIYKLENDISSAEKKVNLLSFWRQFLIIVSIILLGLAGFVFVDAHTYNSREPIRKEYYSLFSTDMDSDPFWHVSMIYRSINEVLHFKEPKSLFIFLISILAILAIALIVLVFTYYRKKVKMYKENLHIMQEECAKKKEEAWEQMKPLNELFSWDIPTKLISKTVPNIKFDPYFNAARLQQLSGEFDYSGFLGEDSSILFAHSGEIKGNPFVIATRRDFFMGTQTYTGSRTIYWTEYETDADGKRRAVTKSEVLTASISKPAPFYDRNTFLLYANDAAPKLIFSREPNGVVDREGNVSGRQFRKKRRELRKFSQNLTDDKPYTMMSNEEFEAIFETKNRNDEVEYRLLFTPLAQKHLLTLIKDTQDAYGDDFSFYKKKKINWIYPRHFSSFNLDTDPKQFRHFDLEEMRKFFLKFNENYFRSIYFAFAPLLSIPLYQQVRTAKNIYGEDLLRSSSHWEWESIANYHESYFAPKASITDNILKTRLMSKAGVNSLNVQVTAKGFSGQNMVHYERVYGGDGRYHTVEVPWIQYHSVSQRTTMTLTEFPDSDQDVVLDKNLRGYSSRSLRRRILMR